MAGEATFTLTEADLVAIGRERLRHWLLKPKAIGGHISALGVIFGLGYAFLHPCDCVGSTTHIRDGLMLAGGVTVWLALYYIVLYFATVPWRTRKILREHAAMRAPFAIAWSDDSLAQSSLHGSATFGWADLKCWDRLPSAFLVYYGTRPAFIVPRRALTDEQARGLDATMSGAGLPLR